MRITELKPGMLVALDQSGHWEIYRAPMAKSLARFDIMPGAIGLCLKIYPATGGLEILFGETVVVVPAYVMVKYGL